MPCETVVGGDRNTEYVDVNDDGDVAGRFKKRAEVMKRGCQLIGRGQSQVNVTKRLQLMSKFQIRMVFDFDHNLIVCIVPKVSVPKVW